MDELDLEEAGARALVLVDEARRAGTRRLLGLAGAPGAGKSSLAEHLVASLPAGSCVRVPMDGFHLADAALERLGRAERKGAVDTFDADGYVALLQRLRTQLPGDGPVWAPMFERELEQPLAGALEVPAGVPLVLTEGNYLLETEGAFARVRALLDACWFVEVPETLRHERLIARHERFGKPAPRAREWALGPDERNARRVAATRSRADAVVHPG
ncbi:nucleoside/nucleotide kinase family protein [Brachybacterium saurashtrense]|uniref:Nucleoside/nucleotide kinase family protein n=1 Tax=Brachybacterium saurashtrense TaxID=556288 RepID=A0A345YJY1_9MICO|nr:nucleoside/nucleotide kinase family protein [Brachybacterium saurashtrense]AXK44233.1 nucleoside/nucleotide kinase family protein [Brachybacterium saurashtrense]RRR21505.1 nucleoside/nucleotide kinase family protein [Brachybacterium saurashtrense]